MHRQQRRLHGCICSLIAAVTALNGVLADTFNEKLLIRPLRDGKVVSHFEFITEGTDDSWQGHSYGDDNDGDASLTTYQTTLLPRSLAAIIRAYEVEEVHLSLTSGRWNYERWQNPIGEHGAPSGGEIHAWIASYEGDTDEIIKERWTGLTNSLGGLFCSSLNILDSRMTVSPTSTFFPSNPLLQSTNQPFFHALLPLEHPCTENLTPFLSLLPCRAKSGIAQLLNPHKLFDANWQRLGVHVLRMQGSGNLRIKLEFEVVQDPVRMTAALGSQPRRDWSFERLFDRRITQACPIATTSLVEVDLSEEFEYDEDDPEGSRTRYPTLEPQALNIHLPTSTKAVFNVAQLVKADPKGATVSMKWPVMRPEGFAYPKTYYSAPLLVSRINTGYGLERARLGIEIRNNNPDSDVQVTWLEEWPWWIKVYLHTLEISVEDVVVRQDIILREMNYTQSHSRGRPTVIEANLLIPKNSTTRLILDIDKAYMRYTDYPPDSHRGFDVPSGVVLVKPVDGKEGEGTRVYTTSTLLDMPTPDFSMPYNVIILTSTVIALFFGNVFNLLTRTWHMVDLQEPEPEDGDKKAIETSLSESDAKPAVEDSAG